MTDLALLEQWLERRDAEAFAAISKRHAGMVYATCLRILRNPSDAEDVAQECFQLLVEANQTPRTNLGGWLHAVATTRSLNRIRSESRRRAREARYAEEQPLTTEIDWNDVYGHIDEAISGLSEEYRGVMVAHFLEGLSYGDIAEETGLARSTVAYRVKRGVELARETLRRRGIPLAAPVLVALLAAHGKAQAAPLALTAALGKLAIAGPLVSAPAAPVPSTGTGLGRWLAGLPKSQVLLPLASAVIVVLGSALYVFQGEKADSEGSMQGQGVQVAAAEGGAEQESEEGPAEAGSSASEESSPQNEAEAENRGSATITVFGEGRFTESRIAGASVTLEANTWGYQYALPPPAPAFEGQTGPDGRLTVTGLPLAQILVVAASAGRVGTAWLDIEEGRLHDDQAVRVYPAGSLSGVVRDVSGSPVAGALVLPHQFGQDPKEIFIEYAFALRAVTDEAGHFRMPRVRRGSWKLRVYAEGYAPLVTDFLPTAPVAEPAEAGVFTVYRGGTVVGSVVDAESGAPAAHVTVKIPGVSRGDTYLPTTDEAGRYEVAAFPPGENKAMVLDPAYVCVEGPRAFVALDEQTVTIPPLRVSRGGLIEGRVYDAESGEGLPGLEVCLQTDKGALKNTVLTGEEGRYSLPGGLDESHYQTRYTVRVAETAPYTLSARESQMHVRLRDGNPIRGLDFALEAGRPVSGVVLARDGRPVQDVTVTATGGPDGVVLATTSDEAGCFSLEGFPGAFPPTLAAKNEDRGVAQAGPLRVPREGLADVVLRLASPGSLSGVVSAAQGRPLSGWQVKALQWGAEGETEFGPDTTGTQGEFALDGLLPGDYTLCAAPPLVLFTEEHSVLEVHLEEGRRVTGLKLTCEPGLSIAGHAQGSVRTGSGGQVIECEGPVTVRAQSGDYGDFEVRGLVEGLYTVRVLCGKCATAVMENVPAGATDVNFQLHAMGHVSGRVVDRITGEPVPVFDALHMPGTLKHVPPESLDGFVRHHSPDGAFVLKWVDAGDGTVVVRAPGYATTYAPVSDVPFEGVLEGVTVELTPGKQVDGHVVDGAGVPVEAAMIFVGAFPESTYRGVAADAYSDGAGAFALGDLAEGNSDFFAYHYLYAPAHVRASAGRALSFVLEPGGIVEGRVHDGGIPVARQEVALVWPGTGHVCDRTYTDSAGGFAFVNVPAEPMAVQVVLDGAEVPPVDITLSPDQNTHIAIDLANP